MHQSIRLLVAAIATAACLATVSAPAEAQTRHVRDARGDVVSVGEESEPANVAEPDRSDGDVLSLRVSHRRHTVRLVMRAAGLTPVGGDDLTMHSFAFRTDEGRRANLDLVVTAGRPQGDRELRLGGRSRPCRGLDTRVSYAEDLVEVTVPRRCLSSPRWVRVGAGTAVVQGDRLYGDDASRRGSVVDDLTLGRRVLRG